MLTLRVRKQLENEMSIMKFRCNIDSRFMRIPPDSYRDKSKTNFIYV